MAAAYLTGFHTPAQAGTITTVLNRANAQTAGTFFRMAADSNHNLYVGDTRGGVWLYSGSNKPVSKLSTGLRSSVTGIAITPDDSTIYYAEYNSGNLFSIKVADGSPKQLSQIPLNSPNGIALASSGKLYIASNGNNSIIQWDVSDNTQTTLPNMSLSRPVAVAVDAQDNLYIVDNGKNRILRRAAKDGTVTTIAGTGSYGFSGDGGPATSAMLFSPWGVAIDTAGNIYIADNVNFRVRRIDGLGLITTVAGTGDSASTGDNGPATFAQIGNPNDVATDGNTKLYISDVQNINVRQVTFNPPDAPTNLQAVQGNQQATLTWQHSGAVAATSFTAAVVGDASKSCTAPENSYQCTITELTNGQSYTFKVLAHNDALNDLNNPNSQDNSVSAVSGESNAIIPPGVTATLTMATSPASTADVGTLVTLSANFGGVSTPSPTGNIVFCNNANSTDANCTGGTLLCSGAVTMSNGNASASCTPSTLAVGVYNIGAYYPGDAVYLAAPASAVNFAVQSVVPDAPTGVSAIAGDTSATVQWVPPANTGGVQLTGYTVTGLPSGSCATPIVTPPAVPATSCVVSGLANGTAYTFTVVAKNDNKTSASSVSSAAVTPHSELTFAGATPGTIVLTQGIVGQSYSAPIGFSGGLPPYVFSLSGNLPEGLSLNPATGVISGTPSKNGVSTFTITLSDSGAKAASAAVNKTLSKAATTPQSFSITIAEAAVTPIATPVPTLNEWALIGLSALLALFGASRTRRRSA